eukprot:Skav217848  [mRNA]  locus=scaffold3024:101786:102688:+ [translate_table: standard]
MPSIALRLTSQDLSPEAGTTLVRLQQVPQVSSVVSNVQDHDLRSLERKVHAVLYEVLQEQEGKPEISVMHPTPPCDIPLAIPLWKVAVVVGSPQDFFRGPREAWADDSGVGWGRIAEDELDHGALHGDFVFNDVDRMDGMDRVDELGAESKFEVEAASMPFSSSVGSTSFDTLDASDTKQPSGEWQRLPALRMRLLKRLGWKIVEVPYFEWRSLLRSEEQRFLKKLLHKRVGVEGAEPH